MNDQPVLNGQRIVTVRPSGRVSGGPRVLFRTRRDPRCSAALRPATASAGARHAAQSCLRNAAMTDGTIADLRQNDIEDAEPGSISKERLRSIVERIERLEDERKALAGDIKDIYAEAKSVGFDVKVLRQLISLRAKEPAEVEEQETLLDLYRRALGI
jgi:uncharacterized protein (UPF0335 family)